MNKATERRAGQSDPFDDMLGYHLRRLSVLAFQRSNGARLWESFVPEGRGDNWVHGKNGHASGTAATATDLLRATGVQAVTLEGGMRAWSLAWSTALGTLAVAAVCKNIV